MGIPFEASLIRQQLAVPLNAGDPDEVALWCAYDLAAVVESCFGHRTFPLGAAREPWLDRLAGTYLPPFPEVVADTRRLFLLDDGVPAGTLALPEPSLAGIPLVVSCLYLRPESRGGGCATRALEVLQTAAEAVGGPGIQLDTHWPWRSAVRFYLRRRMWVMGWERHLSFAWLADRGSWEARLEGDVLRLQLQGRTVAHAKRSGSHLARFEARDSVSAATLALLLAERGWPLVRRGGPHADGPASPERLAEAIRLAEARAHELGWVMK